MGFKADTSFLRFLSMGAAGVHQTIRQLKTMGFEPIELERYCGSNKIWTTKVKRLRLPDLLCVKTGLRLEARAKSKLEIKMSDAPANPDRVWDAGLRGDDLVSIIASFDTPDGPQPAQEAEFFTVESLRDSVGTSKLGQPKSAGEGAERDLTWPATVPSRDSTVISVTAEKIVVRQHADAERKERKQTYTLKGKTPYVVPGETVQALTTFIAGTPAAKADMPSYLGRQYNPLNELQSQNNVDRYAAVKSLPHREDPRDTAVAALEHLIPNETEDRVALEAAGSAVILGSNLGEDRIADFVWNNDDRPDLRMEAVLILTELGRSTFTHDQLTRIAVHESFQGNEIRQCAVWGIGKAGLRAYDDLLPFIDDPEENVALHAIAAFGNDTPRAVIDQLIQDLIAGDPRRAPAASEVLRTISNTDVLTAMIEAARANPSGWLLATLGRLPPDDLRGALRADPLLEQISPMLLLSDADNWLAGEDMQTDISFLLKQNL